MNDHGFVVVAYNRTSQGRLHLANEAKGTKVVGAHSLEEMVAKLKKPRKVMMLVKAGSAVDDFIAKLLPLLEKGTSSTQESDANAEAYQRVGGRGLLYCGLRRVWKKRGLGTVPICPGGQPSRLAYRYQTHFQAICVKISRSLLRLGGGGRRRPLVKDGPQRVGIEYGDMQLICGGIPPS